MEIPSTSNNDGSSSSTASADEELKELKHYFESSADKRSAKCLLCTTKSTFIKTKNFNTTGLHSHLEDVHKIKAKKRVQKSKTVNQEKQCQGIINFGKKSNLSMVLARMVSSDGLPFRVLETSCDIRNGLRAQGYEIPKSRLTVKKLVMDYGLEVRAEQKQKVLELKRQGRKFSITLDEWTSTRSRRYMNVYLHSQGTTSWNLGLVRIIGSFTSEACLEKLREKLRTYDICLENDVVSIHTDGPSVMVKLGRISPTHHQMCFAHGLQLAVLDVLYTKTNSDDKDSDAEADETNSREERQSESDDEDEELQILPDEGVAVGDLCTLIDKVRKVVKMYRKSPLKYENLQNYVASSTVGKRELKLILDCKTRWSSLLHMLERFVDLKSSIKKSLVDVQPTLSFEEHEFSKLEEVVDALKPMATAVETLCRREANLVMADAVLKFAYDKLNESDSEISKQLKLSLVTRIQERRTEVSNLLDFLHTGKTQLPTCELFGQKAKGNFPKTVRDFVMRLTNSSEPSDDEEEGCDDQEVPPAPKKSCRTEMQAELDSIVQQANSNQHKERCVTKNNNTLLQTIKKEIGFFENGGSRGHHLQCVYDWLMTIKPTSVESERAFSAAGSLCTKVRSRLNDDTLDGLCFLRSHFKSEK